MSEQRHLETLAAARWPTVVIDPPWQQKGGTLRGREGFLDAGGHSEDLPYPSLSLEQIRQLPVGDVAADNAHLYLWTTNKYLPEAFGIARAWGFTYSTTLVWAKNPIGAGLGGAYGIATEFCLFCRRGTLGALAKSRTTWFNWKRPYDERGKPRHSSKPPEFHALVESISPGPYLELFARDWVPGWSAWGNEFTTGELPADWCAA